MIISMTGFGAAAGAVGTLRVTVEIRAVNHRFFNPTIKLPGTMARWEGDVRELLRKRFARGHLTLSAWAERDTDTAVGIDEERFGAYVTQLRGLRDRFSLAGDVDIATVMRLPEILTTSKGDEDDSGTIEEFL
ncbi:MAG TPA: YicC/YloC family endoribonuclease, partial [Gemmatimonadaceae bacterium]|nr:YicC/YloC family endoribonuclease [Gemmatimonadaceae bacterium]